MKSGWNAPKLKDPKRQTLGKLNWLACMSRPEISFTVSDVSSRITTASIADVKLINKAIKFLKSHTCHITVPKFNLNNLSIKVFNDASFNNHKGGQSQGGYITWENLHQFLGVQIKFVVLSAQHLQLRL